MLLGRRTPLLLAVNTQGAQAVVHLHRVKELLLWVVHLHCVKQVLL